jgi:hypothetical protein
MEFANEKFIRGQPHLLKNIHRRKPVHSHSLPNQQGQANASPLSESERHSLKEEIERLRHEKDQLRLGQEIDALAGARSSSLRFVGHVCVGDPGRDDEAAFQACFRW